MRGMLHSKKFWIGAVAGTILGKWVLNSAGNVPVVNKIVR
jgi:hypothetical protein